MTSKPVSGVQAPQHRGVGTPAGGEIGTAEDDPVAAVEEGGGLLPEGHLLPARESAGAGGTQEIGRRKKNW